MRRIPQPGEIYQHFKGNLYRIVTLAKHTETGEELVVYQALYGELQVYARPLSMFLSEVDHRKYPQAKYRFTLLPPVGTVMPGKPDAASAEPDIPSAAPDALPAEPGITSAEPGTLSGKPDTLSAASNTESAAPDAPQEDEFVLDPALLRFLEADSYEEKLEVFSSMAGITDEDLLNTIAVSLDFELSEGSPEEKYDAIKNCLLTLEKYECNRLR